MKIKLLCSAVDCDHEVDIESADSVYAIGELEKIDRLCFSCQKSKDDLQRQERKERQEKIISVTLYQIAEVHAKLRVITQEDSEWRKDLAKASEERLKVIAARVQTLFELAQEV